MALEAVEEVYGSIEQFALFVLTDNREILDSSRSITLRAEEANLPPNVLSFLLTQSRAFRRLMREMIVNESFDLFSERKHIEMVKAAATNARKKEVVTPKGVLAHVDHSPDEIMKAGEYLNKYRGTPLSGTESSSGPSLVINFGHPEVGNGEKTITLEAAGSGEEYPTGFKRLRAGGLPPSGVRKRYFTGESQPNEGHALTRAGGELDFDSQEAPSSQENSEIEE